MDLLELNFERLECLDGTWSPMMAAGEDHFVGTVRHTMYTPGVYGFTTQVLNIIHLVVPRAPYTSGPTEIIDLSSDSSEEELGEELEEAPEKDDMEEDLDYKPSEMSLSYMSSYDSDDSGYTQSPDLPASHEYYLSSSDSVYVDPIPVHADGAVPVAD